MTLKVLDLFSGIGGFSYGLEKTGHYETIAFCELDKSCQQVLKKHWPDVPCFSDIKTLQGYKTSLYSTEDNLSVNASVDIIKGWTDLSN